IPNPNLSIAGGAIHASGWSNAESGSISRMYYDALGARYGFTLDTPICDFSEEAREALLYGTKGEPLDIQVKRFSGASMSQPFEGIINNLERRYRETSSDYMRAEIEDCMSAIPCQDCGGQRLKKEILAVTVGGRNIAEYCALSVTKALDFMRDLELNEMQHKIGDRVIKEILDRLGFLQSVGLEYLTLSRASGTLSGGESQRIRLATQIGSSLMGVLYILDEPSIGLHQRDNDKLLDTLKQLRDVGNTLIVVEHDEDTMYAADHIVDIGPGAGVHGGEIIFQGTVEDMCKAERSITGAYLSGRRFIPIPEIRRKGSGKWLSVYGAAVHNLKHTDFSIPLGTLTCVTGVSGSGKSSFVNEILYKKLASELNGAKTRAGAFDSIKGMEYLDKVID
ncbi:MAG: excinuclease ABC subunit UvrA, partial [Butyricicoccus sp.]